MLNLGIFCTVSFRFHVMWIMWFIYRLPCGCDSGIFFLQKVNYLSDNLLFLICEPCLLSKCFFKSILLFVWFSRLGF